MSINVSLIGPLHPGLLSRAVSTAVASQWEGQVSICRLSSLYAAAHATAAAAAPLMGLMTLANRSRWWDGQTVGLDRESGMANA